MYKRQALDKAQAALDKAFDAAEKILNGIDVDAQLPQIQEDQMCIRDRVCTRRAEPVVQRGRQVQEAFFRRMTACLLYTS